MKLKDIKMLFWELDRFHVYIDDEMVKPRFYESFYYSELEKFEDYYVKGITHAGTDAFVKIVLYLRTEKPDFY